MKTVDAIKYFGEKAGGNEFAAVAIADALGIWRTAVYQWGAVVPELRAHQLQTITAGELKIDPNCYRKKKRRAE